MSLLFHLAALYRVPLAEKALASLHRAKSRCHMQVPIVFLTLDRDLVNCRKCQDLLVVDDLRLTALTKQDLNWLCELERSITAL